MAVSAALAAAAGVTKGDTEGGLEDAGERDECEVGDPPPPPAAVADGLPEWEGLRREDALRKADAVTSAVAVGGRLPSEVAEGLPERVAPGVLLALARAEGEPRASDGVAAALPRGDAVERGEGDEEELPQAAALPEPQSVAAAEGDGVPDDPVNDAAAEAEGGADVSPARCEGEGGAEASEDGVGDCV